MPHARAGVLLVAASMFACAFAPVDRDAANSARASGHPDRFLVPVLHDVIMCDPPPATPGKPAFPFTADAASPPASPQILRVNIYDLTECLRSRIASS